MCAVQEATVTKGAIVCRDIRYYSDGSNMQQTPSHDAKQTPKSQTLGVETPQVASSVPGGFRPILAQSAASSIPPVESGSVMANVLASAARDTRPLAQSQLATAIPDENGNDSRNLAAGSQSRSTTDSEKNWRQKRDKNRRGDPPRKNQNESANNAESARSLEAVPPLQMQQQQLPTRSGVINAAAAPQLAMTAVANMAPPSNSPSRPVPLYEASSEPSFRPATSSGNLTPVHPMTMYSIPPPLLGGECISADGLAAAHLQMQQSMPSFHASDVDMVRGEVRELIASELTSAQPSSAVRNAKQHSVVPREQAPPRILPDGSDYRQQPPPSFVLPGVSDGGKSASKMGFLNPDESMMSIAMEDDTPASHMPVDFASNPYASGQNRVDMMMPTSRDNPLSNRVPTENNGTFSKSIFWAV